MGPQETISLLQVHNCTIGLTDSDHNVVSVLNSPRGDAITRSIYWRTDCSILNAILNNQKATNDIKEKIEMDVAKLTNTETSLQRLKKKTLTCKTYRWGTDLDLYYNIHVVVYRFIKCVRKTFSFRKHFGIQFERRKFEYQKFVPKCLWCRNIFKMTKLNIPESSLHMSPLRAIVLYQQYCRITVIW